MLLDTINGLRVINFLASAQLLLVCADSLEQSGKTAFLTTKALFSQKTHNIKLLVHFSRFPVITHRSKSDKQTRSYDHCKLGGAAKNSFLDRSSYLDNSDFQLTSNGKLTELVTQRL
jgi:hypothetical protein